MSKLKTFMRLATSDWRQLWNILRLKLIKWLKSNGSFIPDRIYLKIMFYLIMGKKLNFRTPKTFNEKLQWLKIYDREPLYTTLVDKSLVKKYVANIIGEQYVIPTIGVWNDIDEINFDSLPDKFVLKTTQGGAGAGVIICKDKKNQNKDKIRKRLQAASKQNIFKYFREWPYKNIKPRIIAEPLLEDNLCGELKDYKFFCFNGQVKALFIASDRMIPGEEVKFDFFDENFNYLQFTNGHPNAKIIPSKPTNFELMKKLAGKLSKGIPHVRIDFYEVNGQVYFGEMTFYHHSGMTPFNPDEWDYKFGEWLSLPHK